MANAAPMGENVVVIAVSNVQLPNALPGQCLVRGLVQQVVSGCRFQPGQPLVIKVDCGVGTPILDSRPATREAQASGSVDAAVLAQSKLGVVRLDDTGRVLWQPSPDFAADKFSQYGKIAGYRVLEGSALPIGRDRMS
jgi:hypothetical protein